MKKVLLTLVPTLLFFNLAHAQTDWITYKIDDKLSVKLPAEPEKIDRGVTAHTKDSLICFAYKIAEVDSATLTRAVASPGFADGLKQAMASSQEGVNLGEMKTGKWNGYTCYSVDGEKTAVGLKASFLLLIIQGRIYAFGAMMPGNHDINQKNIFFNTIKLN
ncbi:MAG TPA: hypothetical protein VG367_21230 [Mucilaginibacter sp.]|jgi:hypothetical protein|nr:hypothetical protein [Mucilaginibacter sp.]